MNTISHHPKLSVRVVAGFASFILFGISVGFLAVSIGSTLLVPTISLYPIGILTIILFSKFAYPPRLQNPHHSPFPERFIWAAELGILIVICMLLLPGIALGYKTGSFLAESGDSATLIRLLVVCFFTCGAAHLAKKAFLFAFEV